MSPADREEALINAKVAGQPIEMSFRTFLILRATLNGTPLFLAVEAVSSTAIEHPEWDMDERQTWSEWSSRLSG